MPFDPDTLAAIARRDAIRSGAIPTAIAYPKGCGGCREKALKAAREAEAKAVQPDTLSVILPARNERLLPDTLRSLAEGVSRPLQVIVVDDASTVPIKGAAIRNDEPIGATRSRQLGFLQATGRWACFPDAHMEFPRGNLEKLCDLSSAHHGIAYCGCNKHSGCELRLGTFGLEAKWFRPGFKGQGQTNSMMGACYVIEREVLLKLGGWIGLPGFLGSQELAMSILAARCGVPIWLDATLQNHHEFRQNATLPYPPDMHGWDLNHCVVHRIMFSDRQWAKWKPMLLTRFDAGTIAEAEQPQYLEYGEQLRQRMTVPEEDFLAPILKRGVDHGKPARRPR